MHNVQGDAALVGVEGKKQGTETRARFLAYERRFLPDRNLRFRAVRPLWWALPGRPAAWAQKAAECAPASLHHFYVIQDSQHIHTLALLRCGNDNVIPTTGTPSTSGHRGPRKWTPPCHPESFAGRTRDLGRRRRRPAPDASPLRLAQHDIFGAMTGSQNRSIHHNKPDAVLATAAAWGIMALALRVWDWWKRCPLDLDLRSLCHPARPGPARYGRCLRPAPRRDVSRTGSGQSEKAVRHKSGRLYGVRARCETLAK